MSGQGSQTTQAAGTSHPKFLEQVIYVALAPIFGNAIYPGAAADDTLPPFAVQTRISDVPNDTLADGRNLSIASVQLDIYSLRIEEALTLAELVKTAIDALIGPTMGVTLQRGQTLYDSDMRLHRIILEFDFSLPRNGGTS